MPVSAKLFVPESWVDDPARLNRASVPEEYRIFCTKPEMALAEIDRLLKAGVSFRVVLADAG